jgi:formylglycine-generating enzyme required for sulfatase activity
MALMSVPSVSLARLHPVAQGLPPAWAWEWGDDRYGPWCSFRIKGVVQRLRWIPPGQFVMGSPSKEAGRLGLEGLRRTVRIPEGFWLFDTPCPQELWEAVMGYNTSYFRSPTRPAESVSWQDCQEFVERLNGLLEPERMTLSLPSEAQWEYACRAGTTTATYAGNLEILGQKNAPVLDAIAWYGGNCGVDFELNGGADISRFPEKHYDLKVGGTHPVCGKAPNGWGLYDMLGNVWEMCLDEVRVRDGLPSKRSAASIVRVVRGGSWISDAREVRAAAWSTCDPYKRDIDRGFRCAEFRAGEVVRAGEPA